MAEQHVRNTHQLIDVVGAGNADPSAPGPVVCRAYLWDDRIVEARYHRCREGEVDIKVREDIIWDNERLRPLVERLLNAGTSFVTETGSHDMVCTLQWTIRS